MLSKNDLQKFSGLARIKLSDKELAKFGKEISDILEFVRHLNEVSVSDIGYAAHVDDFEGDVLREDKPGKAMSEDEVFKNGKGRRKGKFFSTSKII